MHTPQWYGSIGIINSAHTRRRGILSALRNAIADLVDAVTVRRRPRSGSLRLRNSATRAARSPYR